MTTDPEELPDADSHTGDREVDPVTGYDTTGHDWGGIRELNTPFPKLPLIALALAVIYSVAAWILLPAWPLGSDYTRGMLKLDQGEMALRGVEAMGEIRQRWLSRFEAQPDFAALAPDSALMARAMPAADRLFQDNCSACHGLGGGGNSGFPVLRDGYWLWGGDPATIAETLRVGINANHPETRFAQMPAFDWMDRTDRMALADYVAALPSGTAEDASPAATLFSENCVACHGEGGAGGLMNGAPSLVDASVIYGQDAGTVLETLRNGRQGVMPSWRDRLSAAEINALALYVSRMSGADGGAGQ